MSFALFRLVYSLAFLVVLAVTARPYDVVTWTCVGIGILGAAWIIYWLPYRILEIQDEYGPRIEAMKSQLRERKSR